MEPIECVIILPQFLSRDECNQLRQGLVNVEFDVIGDGETEHQRYDFADTQLSHTIGLKLRPHLPRWVPQDSFVLHEWYASRYSHTKSEALGVHVDGKNTFYGNESVLTLLIYLNDDFDGGETVFVDKQERELDRIVPQSGKAVLLSQNLLHKALPPQRGTKLILRSDIMIRVIRERTCN